MQKQRIFIPGSDSVSLLAPSSRRNDPRAVAAALAMFNVRADVPPRFPAPQWPSLRVGALDMTDLPNADPSKTKVEWLPLTTSSGTSIAAGVTQDFELKPTKYARPGPLVIPDTLAQNLIMTNLQIGGKPVFAGQGAVPCALFSEKCIVNALSSYVASNNASITFTLKNIHASAAQVVFGVWLCDTQELQV